MPSRGLRQGKRRQRAANRSREKGLGHGDLQVPEPQPHQETVAKNDRLAIDGTPPVVDDVQFIELKVCWVSPIPPNVREGLYDGLALQLVAENHQVARRDFLVK